jgi:hypothetical protein
VVALNGYTKMSSEETGFITHRSIATVSRIYGRAIERGFDPYKHNIQDSSVEIACALVGQLSKLRPKILCYLRLTLVALAVRILC